MSAAYNSGAAAAAATAATAAAAAAAAALVRFKLASAVLTLLVAALGTALPWIFHRMLSERAFRLLSLGNMLSVGVMLGGGLLHLLPEAVEGATAEKGFPFPYLAFSLGLLLPLCVKQLLHSHDGGGEQLLHAHELKRPSSSPSSCLLVAGPSSAEGSHLRSRRVRGDLGERHGEAHLADPVGVLCDSGHDESTSSSQDEDDDGLAQLAKLPLTSVLVLQVALSFHSLLEGLGQGAAPTPSSAAQMLLLITLHKGLTAFALGSSLHHASLSCGLTTLLAAVFVLATPLGILVGAALSASELGAWSHLVMAAAAGTFVYVALCEVMPRELLSRRAPRGAQLASMAAGYAAMAVMAIWV